MRTVVDQVIHPVCGSYAAQPSATDRQAASLLSISTLVIWLFCLGVGLAGLLLPYTRPKARQAELPPVRAELLNVQFSPESLAAPLPEVTPSAPTAPPPLQRFVLPATPPAMLNLAEPSPAVSFAVPVEAPGGITEAAQASSVTRSDPVASIPAALPPVQAITYGQGEGRQPAPDYPRRAVLEGQEGVVTIRFSVREDGLVAGAEAVSPSPWPLLNQAALRVVRERWRFRQGPPRLYEVGIRFQLTK